MFETTTSQPHVLKSTRDTSTGQVCSSAVRLVPEVAELTFGTGNRIWLQSGYRRVNERGQTLVEYALMVPLLFILIANIVNFGGLLYGWITVANAARAGAQYGAMGGAYATYPTTATLAQIKTLVENEASALPNSSSTNPVVTVCENNNGTVIDWGGGTCPAGVTSPPQDPEDAAGTTTYSSLAIDVTYTYTQFISSGLKFPILHLFTLALPTSIHTRIVMRVLN